MELRNRGKPQSTGAGVSLRGSRILDGLNLLPSLMAGSELPSRDFFWHFPHYNMHGSTPASALRSGDYKLIEWYETGQIELYDLETDARESHDLAAARPKLKQALLPRLHHWQQTTGAQLPRPNPDDQPGKRPCLLAGPLALELRDIGARHEGFAAGT